MAEQKKIAIIRLRGNISVHPRMRTTLEFLRLNHVNNCAVVPDTPSYRGMIQKVKDLITWGEISSQSYQQLIAKFGDQKLFRLAPPKKGLGRKGIKRAFTEGGALGNRGEKINELLMRMM